MGAKPLSRRLPSAARPPLLATLEETWARHLNGQRRERDSNPRHLRAAVFKTAPFDRSGISPGPLCISEIKMVLDRSLVVNSLIVTFFIWGVFRWIIRLGFFSCGLLIAVEPSRLRRGLHSRARIVFGNADHADEALLRGQVDQPNALRIPTDTPDVGHLQAH